MILCVLSDNFITIIKEKDSKVNGDEDEEIELNETEFNDEEIIKKEHNFRRYLKARAMQFNVPIQMMRDKIANPSGGMQDPATIAWNFFTAIYYKASGTPWALIRKDVSDSTCYAGISFYKSRDKTPKKPKDLSPDRPKP